MLHLIIAKRPSILGGAGFRPISLEENKRLAQWQGRHLRVRAFARWRVWADVRVRDGMEALSVAIHHDFSQPEAVRCQKVVFHIVGPKPP